MLIDYLSNIIVPLVITLILICGLKEKVNVFDCFLDGAKEGMEIVVNLFPTLIGLFMAIGILRSSGFIDYLIQLLNPVINFFTTEIDKFQQKSTFLQGLLIMLQ